MKDQDNTCGYSSDILASSGLDDIMKPYGQPDLRTDGH